jgi:hypothetical protein
MSKWPLAGRPVAPGMLIDCPHSERGNRERVPRANDSDRLVSDSTSAHGDVYATVWSDRVGLST